jgi:rare lipoprotein A (peptidoglycan hydrolase)
VTDFGPNKSIFPERIVDLSSEAFSRIAPLSLGVINVMVESVN